MCSLVDMEKGKMKFCFNNEEITFNICGSLNKSSDLKLVCVVNHIEEIGFDVPIEEILVLMRSSGYDKFSY